MNTKRIAVITRDPPLAELCETEGSHWGYRVNILSSIRELSENYERYFVDVDTVNEDISHLDGLVIKMSRYVDILSAEEKFLSLPLSLTEFANALNCVGCFEDNNDKNHKESEFIFDIGTKTLFFGVKSALLSEYELRVLERLYKDKGTPVKREELNALLGARDGNISDVYVCHLRRKFEALCGNRIIKTVRSKGYMIDIFLKIK